MTGNTMDLEQIVESAKLLMVVDNEEQTAAIVLGNSEIWNLKFPDTGSNKLHIRIIP